MNYLVAIEFSSCTCCCGHTDAVEESGASRCWQDGIWRSAAYTQGRTCAWIDLTGSVGRIVIWDVIKVLLTGLKLLAMCTNYQGSGHRLIWMGDKQPHGRVQGLACPHGRKRSSVARKECTPIGCWKQVAPTWVEVELVVRLGIQCGTQNDDMELPKFGPFFKEQWLEVNWASPLKWGTYGPHLVPCQASEIHGMLVLAVWEEPQL